MSVYQTICGMCSGDNCGVDVTVEDGRVVDIRGSRDNPNNEGRLCVLGRAGVELMAGRDRLDYPLLAGSGGWRRISWDAALDTIAEELLRVKARYGAPAFTLWEGCPMGQLISAGWDQRFLNLFGSPNWAQHDHLCYMPSVIAERLTYGREQIDGFEAELTRCVVLWGSNPATSHSPFQWHAVQEARRRGATLIVVDPRRSQPAGHADLHLAPRPGTDLALALGVLNHVIAEKLYDEAFVERWTRGFAELAARVRPYTPAWAAETAGVSAGDIRRLAELYAGAHPAHLDAGNALEHHSNALSTLRTLMILRAVTGNLDVPGGNVLPPDLPLPDLRLAGHLPAGLRPLGADRYPLFVEMAGFVPGNALLDAMLSERPYPVKAVLMQGTNPLLTWPNTARVEQALARLDLLVVCDLYLTATARRAHIVLPAASPYEKTELVVSAAPHGPGQPAWWLALRRPLVDPGERRSEWWVLRELAVRLGYAADYPWNSEEEAIDEQLRPLGLTVADLIAHPGGMYWGAPPAPRRYEREGFRTPSGKVELSSQVLAGYSYDPLPRYEAPAESPEAAPALAAAYPLVLNVGHRLAGYTHSRYRNLPGLRARAPEPLAEIHPATAERCGIADGDRVVVETPRGAIRLRAQVTDEILPGVVGLVHGWEEANANLLTDDQGTDPILATPPLRSGLCRIARVPPPPAPPLPRPRGLVGSSTPRDLAALRRERGGLAR